MMKKGFCLCLLGASLFIHAQNQKRPVGDELANIDHRTIRIVEELDAYPLDEYFKKSEEAARRELETYMEHHHGKTPNGIRITSGGSIRIQAWVAPHWVPAGLSFTLILADLRKEPSRGQVIKRLLEKGFRKDDIQHLEIFDINRPNNFEKELKRKEFERLLAHPLSHLYLKPTLEQLDAVTDEDILEFLTHIIDKGDADYEEAIIDFLKKLHPHSRRVFMTVAYEHYLDGTTVTLIPPKTLEDARRYREQKIRLAKQEEGK